MQDDTIAMITYDEESHIASKDLFNTIKGTKKTIVFSNNEVQWRFIGSDIINPKDIDLLVNMKNMSSKDAASNTALAKLSSAGDMLILDFASNGQLPGKAQVRVKSDYVYAIYNLSHAMFLYYINGNSVMLEDQNLRYFLDASDHWCEFEITHNSRFAVSGKMPPITQMILPSRMKTIEEESFANIQTNKIIVPSSVKSIKSRAFANCKNLWYLELPAGKITISDDVLAGCSNVIIICKQGSQAELWALKNGYNIEYK